MHEQQTAPVCNAPSAIAVCSPEVALALLGNVRSARAILRTFILAISAQDDHSVSYDDKAGTSRWNTAIGAVVGKLAQARDALIGDCSGLYSVDWVMPLTLAEALDAALWYGFSCAEGERLNNSEAVAVAQAVVDVVDDMLRECEAAGVNQIASLSQVPSLH